MIKLKITHCALFIILLLISPIVSAVNFGLFGDISVTDSDVTGEYPGFALGDMDFYATQEISDNTRGFVELVFENTDAGIVTDLERFWIMRSFNDEFNISAGRFHSPLGRWNRTYHHGAIVQDTVSRPFFLDFEDGNAGVLPVHVVGVMMTGDFIRTNDEINYEFAIGNGPALDSSAGFSPATKPEININGSSDSNANKTMALRVIYGHDNAPVKFGIFAMNHEVGESNATLGLTSVGSALVAQTIYGTDILYSANSFEVLIEYYQFNNNNKVGSSGSYNATAWFVQLAYTIVDDFKVVVREETLVFDKDNDSYFRLLGTEQARHHVLALRYDLDESNALKMELNISDYESSTDTSTVTLQWAFLIP